MPNRSLSCSSVVDLPLTLIQRLLGIGLGPGQIYVVLYYVVRKDTRTALDALCTEIIWFQARICDVLVDNGEGIQTGLAQAGRPVVLGR